MVSKSKSRSRAPRDKQPSPDAPPIQAILPATTHDAQVLTIKQWSQLNGFSTRTAKRHFKAGTGPQRGQLSPGRVGITVAAHKAWLQRRMQGAAA